MALTGREMVEAARKAVAKIPNDQLHAQLTAGTPVVVIDVREREEWDAGHIPQGTILPRDASKAASRNSSRIRIRPSSPIEQAKAALPWQGRLSWRWDIRMSATSPVALTTGKLLECLWRNRNP